MQGICRTSLCPVSCYTIEEQNKCIINSTVQDIVWLALKWKAKLSIGKIFLKKPPFTLLLPSNCIIGMNNQMVLKNLDHGYRMPKPQSSNINCPDSLYDIMTICWNQESDTRPTFEHLKNTFEDFLIATQDQYVETWFCRWTNWTIYRSQLEALAVLPWMNYLLLYYVLYNI